MAFFHRLLLISGVLLATPVWSQSVAAIKLPALTERLAQANDTTYVVNFWATWCAPCLEELPYFEQVNATYAQQPVKVLLVSLDYSSQLEKRVKPFVQKRGLKATVLLLNESDPNAWLEKIDSKWSGAIPFTLIVNNAQGRRQALEKPLTLAELTAELRAFGH